MNSRGRPPPLYTTPLGGKKTVSFFRARVTRSVLTARTKTGHVCVCVYLMYACMHVVLWQDKGWGICSMGANWCLYIYHTKQLHHILMKIAYVGPVEKEGIHLYVCTLHACICVHTCSKSLCTYIYIIYIYITRRAYVCMHVYCVHKHVLSVTEHTMHIYIYIYNCGIFSTANHQW